MCRNDCIAHVYLLKGEWQDQSEAQHGRLAAAGDQELLSGSSWGAQVALVFSVVNLFCMALLYGCAGRVNSQELRFLATRAVNMGFRKSIMRRAGSDGADDFRHRL